jgi:hypothetical protein
MRFNIVDLVHENRLLSISDQKNLPFGQIGAKLLASMQEPTLSTFSFQPTHAFKRRTGTPEQCVCSMGLYNRF